MIAHNHHTLKLVLVNYYKLHTMESNSVLDNEMFNDVIVELYSKGSLPLKASELVTRYAIAFFKIKQTTPSCDHDSLFELVSRMNYEAAS
jgi:hypothetical protein